MTRAGSTMLNFSTLICKYSRVPDYLTLVMSQAPAQAGAKRGNRFFPEFFMKFNKKSKNFRRSCIKKTIKIKYFAPLTALRMQSFNINIT